MCIRDRSCSTFCKLHRCTNCAHQWYKVTTKTWHAPVLVSLLLYHSCEHGLTNSRQQWINIPKKLPLSRRTRSNTQLLIFTMERTKMEINYTYQHIKSAQTLTMYCRHYAPCIIQPMKEFNSYRLSSWPVVRPLSRRQSPYPPNFCPPP